MRSNVYRDAPVSADFEFSVSNYNNSRTMSADELFFKGRLLPLKEGSCSNSSQKVTTLRDELQNDEEDEDNNNGNSNGNGDFSLRPPKNPARWRRGFLGLRKSHIGSKKSDKGERSGGDYHHDVDVQCSTKNSQVFFFFHFFFVLDIHIHEFVD
ncbi:hypothetical protein BUALT_Bualt04G0113300 [Buddleja alternifolia]|uniref:Uncharacterized protein n=1 Tax=Buddleja alternifolia TaxID=168488 RepID=A0AAV6XW86_9LAMI|nr:hypothetical protein BUALT_Bualt04G0113300 [Buddleja alternifolia]